MPRSLGLFLSLDGVDGAGKSTQAALLADWLRARGETVTTCRDPGGTAVGDRIRALLLDRQAEISLACEMFLYMASRAQLAREIILPALERGDVVVADRYLLANVVYQGHAGGLPAEDLWQAGKLATMGRLPDLTLVLDLPPASAMGRKRGAFDRMESKGLAFLEKVRSGFLHEARRDPGRIKVLDAAQPVAAVQERIREEVLRVLGPAERP